MKPSYSTPMLLLFIGRTLWKYWKYAKPLRNCEEGSNGCPSGGCAGAEGACSVCIWIFESYFICSSKVALCDFPPSVYRTEIEGYCEGELIKVCLDPGSSHVLLNCSLASCMFCLCFGPSSYLC